MELRKKIIELFEYRHLPELIMMGNGSMHNDFYELLIQLQTDIYYLDDVLEQNWDIDPALLEEKWSKIYQSLQLLGIDADHYHSYCSYIYQYQKHELELRKDLMPTRHDLEYFYYFKSCDVKLIRSIIYDKYPTLSEVVSLEDWRLFDLVTEINDDVEDVFEDCLTINANSFLISIIEIGKKETRNKFIQFLNQLSRENKIERNSVLGHQEITEQQITKTKDLLVSNINKISNSELSHCVLLKHCKI